MVTRAGSTKPRVKFMDQTQQMVKMNTIQLERRESSKNNSISPSLYHRSNCKRLDKKLSVLKTDDSDSDIEELTEPLSAAMRRLSMVSNRHGDSFQVKSFPIKELGRRHSIKM